MTIRTVKRFWIANFILQSINVAINGNSEWDLLSILMTGNLLLCIIMLIILLVPTIQPKGRSNYE